MESEQDKEWFCGLAAFEKGMTYYEEKDFQSALACFDNAIECGYEDNIYGFRADCLQNSGLCDQAIRNYDIAISKQPNDCNLYFQRSISKSIIGDVDGAIGDIEEAIQLSKIDNERNANYRAAAIHQGWPGGHTELYEYSLTSENIYKWRVSLADKR
jgi:tetratricopeptide (TPR) repeat protein